MAIKPSSRTLLPTRTRALGVGHLRAFESVARHLNFRAAGDEMALTQSAISRQIQALEDELGVALLLRHTRAVELTVAGQQLLNTVQPLLQQIDRTVQHIRQNAHRRSVAVSTTASFASMWLIPRLEEFQRTHPDIDIRIDATDTVVDLDVSDVDVALRYCVAGPRSRNAVHMFGEQLLVVASPWLLKSGPPLRRPQDLEAFTLIEAGDSHRHMNNEYLSWKRWFLVHGLHRFQPKRWLYFNYAHQIAQATLSGQGVALARTALVTDNLRQGDLIEVLPGTRIDSPLAYWLLRNPQSEYRPEVQAFVDWLLEQAMQTRKIMCEDSPCSSEAPVDPKHP